MYDIKKIKEDIRKSLSDFRYQHTIRVAEEAKSLARYYQIDEEKVYVAGLLHDMAKEFSKEENEGLIEKYKLPQELKKEEFKNIIHADIGAEMAKEYYNIEEDIYLAIKYHTIGNPNMNLFAKVIFVADKIGRKTLSPEMQEAKEFAYEDIDKAMCHIILMEREKLKEKGLKLHVDTTILLSKLEDKKK